MVPGVTLIDMCLGRGLALRLGEFCRTHHAESESPNFGDSPFTVFRPHGTNFRQIEAAGFGGSENQVRGGSFGGRRAACMMPRVAPIDMVGTWPGTLALSCSLFFFSDSIPSRIE